VNARAHGRHSDIGKIGIVVGTGRPAGGDGATAIDRVISVVVAPGLPEVLAWAASGRAMAKATIGSTRMGWPRLDDVM
jgi:hypothetical protein